MKRVFIRLIFVVAIFLVLLIAWIFRPYRCGDDSSVDSRLAQLKAPREVEVYFYPDGEDSCGFRFKGVDGQSFTVVVWQPKESEKVYVGRLVDVESGELVATPHENILRIACLLRNHEGISKRRDLAVYKISRRLRDRIRLVYREAKYGESYTLYP